MYTYILGGLKILSTDAYMAPLVSIPYLFLKEWKIRNFCVLFFCIKTHLLDQQNQP